MIINQIPKFNQQKRKLEIKLDDLLAQLRQKPDDQAIMADLKRTYIELIDLRAQNGDEFADAMFTDINSYFDQWIAESLE